MLKLHRIIKGVRPVRYCSDCKVTIRGNKDDCPLCGNSLPTKASNNDVSFDDEVYPEILPIFQRHMAIRIMVFISIVTIVASFTIYIIFPTDINWPMLLLFGILSAWLILVLAIRKRYNITKNIMWQVTVISLLSLFWDWETGWRGWSLEYVIPILCVAAMFSMYVIAKVMKLSVRDYIAYFLLDCLFGIVPILFIVFNWIEVLYPSIVCVAVSVIFLFAIIIFQGESIKHELKKRMHI